MVLFSKIVTSYDISPLPIQATGRYESIDATESDQLLEVVLTFDSNPELAATCEPGVEFLHITKENLLFNL